MLRTDSPEAIPFPVTSHFRVIRYLRYEEATEAVPAFLRDTKAGYIVTLRPPEGGGEGSEGGGGAGWGRPRLSF